MQRTNYESEYLEFETKIRTLIQVECPSIAETIWLDYRFNELDGLDQGFLKHPLGNDAKDIEELIRITSKARLIFYEYLHPLTPGKLKYLKSKHDIITIGYIAPSNGSNSYSLRVKVEPLTPLEKVKLLNDAR